MGNPEIFCVYMSTNKILKKKKPWVLSQQDSHQRASHGNGVTSFLVGTSDQDISGKNQTITGQNKE